MTIRDDPGLHCARCSAHMGAPCACDCNLCRCAQQIVAAKHQIDDAYRRWVGFVRSGER